MFVLRLALCATLALAYLQPASSSSAGDSLASSEDAAALIQSFVSLSPDPLSENRAHPVEAGGKWKVKLNSSTFEEKDRNTAWWFRGNFVSLGLTDFQHGSERGSWPYAFAPEEVDTLWANSFWVINGCVIAVFGFVTILTAIGYSAYFMKPSKWAWVMLAASYMILIPGLFTMDFSLVLAIKMPTEGAIGQIIGMLNLPPKMVVTSHNHAPGPLRESTRSFVWLLWSTGGKFGAVAVAFFAFVMPLAKILLLGVGQYFARSPKPERVMLARRCIMIVQVISAWASPDFYAYIMLYYLFRGLNHPPLLEALSILDVGFTFYGSYCILSTISSLFLKLPDIPKQYYENPTEPLILRMVDRSKLVFFTVAAFVCWAPVYIVGIIIPCLSLRLNKMGLVEHKVIPEKMLPFLDQLGIDKIIDADINIADCIKKFAEWGFGTGCLNLVFGWAALTAFALVFTWASMICLSVIAYHIRNGDQEKAAKYLKLSFCLKHLQMLDALIVGCALLPLAGYIYRDMGVMIDAQSGLIWLAVSEGIHNLVYYNVHSAAEYVHNPHTPRTIRSAKSTTRSDY